MLCPTAVGGSWGLRYEHQSPIPPGSIIPPLICCHFCWLQWLTGQFGDVWFFIISEDVSGLELKSFILDWFSRSFVFFIFYHMTFTLCQPVNTPNLSHGGYAYLYLHTFFSYFSQGHINSKYTSQVSSLITIPITNAFRIISIIIILIMCFVLYPGKVTVTRWQYIIIIMIPNTIAFIVAWFGIFVQLN